MQDVEAVGEGRMFSLQLLLALTDNLITLKLQLQLT